MESEMAYFQRAFEALPVSNELAQYVGVPSMLLKPWYIYRGSGGDFLTSILAAEVPAKNRGCGSLRGL